MRFEQETGTHQGETQMQDVLFDLMVEPAFQHAQFPVLGKQGCLFEDF